MKFKEEIQAKYLDIADMKCNGMSLQEIADKKGVSRQRISQILELFPDLIFPDLRHTRSGRKFGENDFFEFTCKNCGKSKKLSKCRINLKKIFCNNKCFKECNGYVIYPESYYKLKTEEEKKKEKNRLMANRFYHKHKKDPHYIEKRRLYNRNQFIRLKKLKKQ